MGDAVQTWLDYAGGGELPADAGPLRGEAEPEVWLGRISVAGDGRLVQAGSGVPVGVFEAGRVQLLIARLGDDLRMLLVDGTGTCTQALLADDDVMAQAAQLGAQELLDQVSGNR